MYSVMSEFVVLLSEASPCPEFLAGLLKGHKVAHLFYWTLMGRGIVVACNNSSVFLGKFIFIESLVFIHMKCISSFQALILQVKYF